MTRNLPLVLALAIVLCTASEIAAQRIAFVNTKYILDQLPEYGNAQKELDKFSKQWQDEIDERHVQIKRMRESFNAEAILLTDEMKRTRLEEIDAKEREARDLQRRRFGPKGDLFKKRQELIQPIQDRVYTAVKEVAGTSYIAIFDLGGQSSNLLFASEKYDKSDSVLRKLGIRPGKEGAAGTKDEEEFGTPPDEEQPPPSRDDGKGGGGSDMKQPR
jgi:outer membrane protein